MITIPWKPFPSFIQEITFEDTPYLLQHIWNSRGEYWTLTFRDRDENPVLLGLKLVKGIELIARYPDRGLPPGYLYVTNESGDLAKPTYLSMIEEADVLLYVTEAEVAAI